MVADSLPGHLAYGYNDATPLLGMANPATRKVTFAAHAVERDSIPVWLLAHEMAHMITGRVDHPESVFNAAKNTVWSMSEQRVQGLLPVGAAVAALVAVAAAAE